MKILIRYFFKTIRLILGPILLFANWITTPRGIKRPENEQAKIDQETSKLTLYQFKTCPFCIKVRRAMKRLSLNIPTCDALKNENCREELQKGGGNIKVPCLRITDDNGNIKWMYESDDIIKYLQDHYA